MWTKRHVIASSKTVTLNTFPAVNHCFGTIVLFSSVTYFFEKIAFCSVALVDWKEKQVKLFFLFSLLFDAVKIFALIITSALEDYCENGNNGKIVYKSA